MKWKTATLATVVNGWSMNTDTMGVYGNYYLKRAIVAQQASAPTSRRTRSIRSISATTTASPLDGVNAYTIHFDKDEMPPVDAFWSVTLYDNEGFQVANRSTGSQSAAGCRSSTTPTVHSTFTSRTSPGKDKEWNWLPAPKGPFNLTMRLYAPKSDALTGKWNPPPVMRTEALPGLVTE